MLFVDRFEVQRHCEMSHSSLPVRWTAADSAKMSSGDVEQSTRSTWNVDRLKSGVTLRQPKISECMGGARPTARPIMHVDDDADDDDDDDDTDIEVGYICYHITVLKYIFIKTCFFLSRL